MLELAYYNQEELNKCIQNIVKNKDLYFYFMYPYIFYSIQIEESDFNSLQFVSKNTIGEIVGYYTAIINRSNEYIEGLGVINFTGKSNIIFSKDTKSFFDEIFINRNYRKITFSAIEQNPAVKLYRKLIKLVNGKEVGTLRENKKLTDGKYYDEVIFEIYREGYLDAIKEYYKK